MRLVLSRGRAVPYSKGLMAASLTASGLGPERAYRVARIVEAELRRDGLDLISTEELGERVLDVLARDAGDEAVERYRRFRRARHLDRPLIVAIGGAPGTGKSTIATEIAHRLGIPRVVATDVVRQVMRGVVSPAVLPQVHTSSFDAASLIPAHAGEADRVVLGYWQQAETVIAGLRNVVSRAVEEHFSAVLEGVHVVPGESLLEPGRDVRDATVVTVVLAVTDAEEHESHFHLRAAHTSDARPVDRYVAAFGAIRRIQEYLLERAERAGVPVIESADIDAAVARVMDLVLVRVAETAPDQAVVG